MLNHTPCIHNESGHIYAYVCFLLRHIVLYVKFGLQADPEETAPEIDAHKTGIAIPIQTPNFSSGRRPLTKLNCIIAFPNSP